MRKSILSFSIACGVALLAACGGSSNGESTTDGLLGKLDEQVQDFYAKSNAFAAIQQRVYQNEGDKDMDKARKLRDELLAAFDKLEVEKGNYLDREIATDVNEGAPMKVVSPFQVTNIELTNDTGKSLEFVDDPDEDRQKWLNAMKLENAVLTTTLMAEVELTEDVRGQQRHGYMGTFDHFIEFWAMDDADSILFTGVCIPEDIDYSQPYPAGTHFMLMAEVRDICNHPYNAPEEDFNYVCKTNKVQKLVLNWEVGTTAKVGAGTVPGELGLFELQGPVKKCTVINEWGNVVRTFDEKGFWLTHDGKKLSEVYPGGIERDEYGRIVKGLTDTEGNGEDYTYNKFGKVAKYNCHIYDSIEEDVYTYDDNGNLLKKHVEMGGMDAEEPYDETYTDIVTDEHGNWTSRKADGTVQKRKIEYYN